MTGETAATSAAFVLAARWFDRVVAVLNTIILARLLVPDDFGIVAMATIAIGLVDVFFDLGVNVALIQNPHPTQEYYDTAWTLRLIQSTLATIVVVAASPLAVVYFGDPRVEPVLRVLALSLLISGFENVGIITFSKTMRFALEFRFLVLKRLAGFVATIVAAWMLRSYWALVIGSLFSGAFGVALSYAMHPMRPRLHLSKVRDILAVSQWMIVRSIGVYFDSNLHRIVVGGRVPASVLGGYSLANDVASLPTSAVLMPLNRVLFPALVLAKHDPTELKRVFLLAFGIQALIGIPFGVGLLLVADDVVRVFLGAKWIMAIPFVKIFAIVHIVSALTTSGGYLLITLGYFRASALLSWGRMAIFAALAYVALPNAGAIEIAWLRTLLTAAGLGAYVFLVGRIFPLVHMREMLASGWRSIVGAGTMSVCVMAAGSLDLPPGSVDLLVKVTIGAIVYVASVVALWHATGRPPGAESYMLGKAIALRARVGAAR